jgi:5-methylcytosine-specific restriction protein A
MPLRICLGWGSESCTARVQGNRCTRHEDMRKRVSNARVRPHRERRPEYGAAERERRAAVVRAWRAEYGDWCPGYGVPAHVSADLTADHLVSVRSGGREDGPLGVLCRSCNGRKRDH